MRRHSLTGQDEFISTPSSQGSLSQPSESSKESFTSTTLEMQPEELAESIKSETVTKSADCLRKPASDVAQLECHSTSSPGPGTEYSSSSSVQASESSWDMSVADGKTSVDTKTMTTASAIILPTGSKEEARPALKVPRGMEEHCKQLEESRRIIDASELSAAAVAASSREPESKPSVAAKVREYVNPEVSDVLRSQLDTNMNHLLNELISAFDFSFNKRAKVALPVMEYTEMFNLGEVTIRRVIQMAKRLQAFNTLEREDQILLLKNCIIRILVIKSSKTFDPTTLGWKVPIGMGSPDSLHVSSETVRQHNPKFQQFFKQYAVWVTTLSRLTKNDDAIIMLIIVVCLFTYQGDKLLAEAEEVSNSRKRYSVLLARVIEDKYQDLVEAYDVNKSIEAMMNEMEPLNDIQDLILQSNVNELEPLIMEIFDIPTNSSDRMELEEKQSDTTIKSWSISCLINQ